MGRGWRSRCSFCRRSATEVSKLVAGRRVTICDRCVTRAGEIMAEQAGGGSGAARPAPGRWAWLLDRIARLRGGHRGRPAECRAGAR